MVTSHTSAYRKLEFFVDNDKIKEECGLFGLWTENSMDAGELTFLGLHSLQHRGQESCGIAVEQQGEIMMHKAMGLVTEVFTAEILSALQGSKAIGHVRYSTRGANSIINAQPLVIRSFRGQMALAHNGNLINSEEIRHHLERQGAIFHSVLDTEIIAHLIAHSGEEDFEKALLKALRQLKGAYSLLIMTGDKIYGIRDPYGFRPLILGKINGDYALSSETSAFHIVGGEALREIKPGEMIVLESGGNPRSIFFASQKPQKFCIFEYIYFARPDSTFDGINVHLARYKMGETLAKEFDVDCDIVVPVPDSGISAAQGFANQKGKPFQWGLIKNKYIGRTFIVPRQSARDLKVKLKLSPVKEIIQGQRVLLIDDSIVRGTTSRQIVKMIRQSGAKEVHLAISSPPVINSCFYGLDTTNRQELIASQNDMQEIKTKLEVDSLHYLSREGMLKSIAGAAGYCDACFSGDYPLDIN